MSMETIELKQLTGKHYLTGVDYGVEQIKQYDWSEEMEDAQVIKFELDGKTYIATEDPGDGYRSQLKTVFVTKEKCKNRFKKVLVFGVMKSDSSYQKNDTIMFYDIEANGIVLEIGTDNIDDYYPSFVGVFRPENLIHNK